MSNQNSIDDSPSSNYLDTIANGSTIECPNAVITIDVSDTVKPSTSTNKRARKCKSKGPNVSKVDVKAKLERSRQSARECRARKKLRYQYLEDLVLRRENANMVLKKEIEQLKDIASMINSDRSKGEIEKRLNEI